MDQIVAAVDAITMSLVGKPSIQAMSFDEINLFNNLLAAVTEENARYLAENGFPLAAQYLREGDE